MSSGNYTPFDPFVPEQPYESFAVSQSAILNNFLQLYNKFAINHVPLDTATTAGNHNVIELVEQDNAQQTGTSEISVYTKDVDGQTDQIFLRYQGNGQEFQYSNYQIYPVTPQNGQTPYFTFLPGGLIVYFGKFTTLPNNTLNLYPPVAKNIITTSFCPITTTNVIDYKPRTDKFVRNGKIWTKILLAPASPIAKTVPSCFYMVMANL